MDTYGKAVVAFLAAAAVTVQQVMGGGLHVPTPAEAIAIAIGVTTAVGVWLVPLAPHAKYGKTAVAVVLAVLQVLSTSVLDGFGNNDVLLTLLTVAGALGVYIAPATSPVPGPNPDVSVGLGSDI